MLVGAPMRRPWRIALTLALALVPVACGKKRTEVRPVDEHEGKGAESCMAIPSIVDRDVTIGEGCKLVVERPIVVKAKLVVGAGTTIAFANGAGIRVENGAIVTHGRQDAPVLFTSHAEAKKEGDWAGVRLVASNGSSLAFTTIEHAGGTWDALPTSAPSASASASSSVSPKTAALYAIAGGPPEPRTPESDRAALVVDGAVRDLALDHVQVVHAANGGASVRGGEAIARMTACSFESNGGFALEVIADQAQILGGNTFGEDVRVMGTVTRSATWPTDVPFVVVGTLRVAGPSTPTLTLSPGTTLRFSSNATLQVGYTAEKGALVATKTTFTAAETKPKVAFWGGIDLQMADASTKIDGCTIESSGASETKLGILAAMGAPAAVISVPLGHKATIVSTTFRGCDAPAFSGEENCDGYEASSKHNRSIGQPLCAIDESLKSFGSLSDVFGKGGVGDDPLGNMFGEPPAAYSGIAGPGAAEGTIGTGQGGGGWGYGSGGGSIGGLGNKGQAATPKTSP